MIDNWRWAGVPFYLRTGKRLKAHATEIALEFKGVPAPAVHGHRRDANSGRTCSSCACNPTRASRCGSAPRCPGQEFNVRSVDMDFTYAETFTEAVARRLRAAAARRARRRPDAVHPRRRSAQGVAHLRPDPRRVGRTDDPPLAPLQGRARGVRRRPTSCSARDGDALAPAVIGDVYGELIVVDDVPGAFAARVDRGVARTGRGTYFSLVVSGGDLARRCYEQLAADGARRHRLVDGRHLLG